LNGAPGYIRSSESCFPHLSGGVGFWEILVPSIRWEITPSIWVGIWCACDLGASLEVSFCLGFRILLHYSSYVGFLFEFEFYGLFRVPFWVLILGYCFGF